MMELPPPPAQGWRESEDVRWCACGLGWNPRRHNGGNPSKRCPACRIGLRSAPVEPKPSPIPPFRLPLALLVARMSAVDDTAARLVLGVWLDDWRAYHARGVTLQVAERLARHAGLTLDDVWPDWRRDRRRHQWREQKRRRQTVDPSARVRAWEAQRRYLSDPDVREYRRRIELARYHRQRQETDAA